MKLLVHIEGSFDGAPIHWLNWSAELLRTLGSDQLPSSRLVVEEQYVSEAEASLRSQGIATAIIVPLRTAEAEALGLGRLERFRRREAGVKAGPFEHQIREQLASDLAAGGVPDVILTFSSVRGLYPILFPDRPIVHIEVGPFGRPPFERSIYLDQEGIEAFSYLSAHLGTVERTVGQNEQQALAFASEFRSAFLEAVGKHKIYKPLIENLRTSYDHIALLSTTVWRTSYVLARTRFASQAELIADVAARTPKTCALLVTDHPFDSGLDSAARTLLSRRYGNLHFAPHLASPDSALGVGPTELLAPEADVILNTGSKAGCLALLCQKPLVAVVPYFGAAGTYAVPLEQASGVLTNPSLSEAERRRNDLALWWIATHYNIPWSKFVADSLKERLERAAYGRPSFELPFEALADNASILAAYREQLAKPYSVQLAEDSALEQDALAAVRRLDQVQWIDSAELNADSHGALLGLDIEFVPPASRSDWYTVFMLGDAAARTASVALFGHGSTGQLVFYFWPDTPSAVALGSPPHSADKSKSTRVRIAFDAANETLAMEVNGQMCGAKRLSGDTLRPPFREAASQIDLRKQPPSGAPFQCGHFRLALETTKAADRPSAVARVNSA